MPSSFENSLREAYVDIKFRGNFSLRAGKQQIIWGESDGFRLLDRANASTSRGTSSTSCRRRPALMCRMVKR